jgi:hypothetical protein
VKKAEVKKEEASDHLNPLLKLFGLKGERNDDWVWGEEGGEDEVSVKEKKKKENF